MLSILARTIGIGIPSVTLDRFWSMLAHYHGQIWNAAEFGHSFGVSDHTVRRYLEALAATFMLRVLRPWAENLANGARADQCYFWATHTGAELDLLVVHGTRRLGFEIKRTTAPGLTPSMRHAIADLGLTRLDVLHAGADTFPLAPSVRAVAAHRLLEDVEPLTGRRRS